MNMGTLYNRKLAIQVVMGFLIALGLSYGVLAYIISFPAPYMLVTRFVAVSRLMLLGGIFEAVIFAIIYVLRLKGNQLSVQNSFVLGMGIFIGIFWLAGALTHGEAMRTFFFQDGSDTFMDYYNSIQYGDEPYGHKVIYPPLINVVYSILGKFVLLQGVMDRALYLRTSQTGQVVFLFYMIGTVFLFLFFLYKVKKGTIRERVFFTAAVFLSGPMLFALERGNSILLAVVFLLVFLWGYQAENKIFQYLSFCALGAAAGIKISPALFGLILLSERRYKDAIIAGIIGIVVFMAPFVFTDGTIFSLVQNIQYANKVFQGFLVVMGNVHLTGSGPYIDLVHFFQFAGRLFNGNWITIEQGLNLLLMVGGIFGVCLCSHFPQWKKLGILAGIIALCPQFSGIYNLLFMILPLTVFLNESRHRKPWDWVYLFLFLGIFVPFINLQLEAFAPFWNDIYRPRISSLMESFCLMVLVTMLEIEVWYNIFCEHWHQSSRIERIGAGLTVGVLLLGMYGRLVGFAPRSVKAFFPSNMEVVHAANGFLLQDGLYAAGQSGAQLLLQTEVLLSEGLLVSLTPPSPKTGGSLRPEQKIAVYLHNTMLGTIRMGKEYPSYLYVEPAVLKDLNLGETAPLRLVVLESRSGEEIFPISYIGPAMLHRDLSLDTSPQWLGSRLEDTSYGIFRLGSQLWMGHEARILWDASSVDKGLLLQYQAPESFLADHPGEQMQMDILVDDHHIKTVPIDTLQPKTVLLQPWELRSGRDGKMACRGMELCLRVNGTYTDPNPMAQDTIPPRSVCLTYLGPCAEDHVVIDRLLSREMKTCFQATSLRQKGLCLVYGTSGMVMHSLFSEPLRVGVYLNGKLAGERVVEPNFVVSLEGIYLPPSYFSMHEGIVEVEIRLSNSVVDAPMLTENHLYDRKIGVRYFGAAGLENALNSLNVGIMEHMSQGIRFDGKQQTWQMGHMAEFVLNKQALLERPFFLEYKAPEFLFTANPGENISLTIFINGEAVSTVPISSDHGTVTIPMEVCRPRLGLAGEAATITLKVSHSYNLKKMGILRQEGDDRSLQIVYAGAMPTSE